MSQGFKKRQEATLQAKDGTPSRAHALGGLLWTAPVPTSRPKCPSTHGIGAWGESLVEHTAQKQLEPKA